MNGIALTVPICPLSRDWENNDGKRCSRTQIPLCTAHAVTIHKSQGATLLKTVVDIGTKEFAAGINFVGLSRVRNFRDLASLKFLWPRLNNLRNSVGFKNRILELERIQSLGVRTNY